MVILIRIHNLLRCYLNFILKFESDADIGEKDSFRSGTNYTCYPNGIWDNNLFYSSIFTQRGCVYSQTKL